MVGVVVEDGPVLVVEGGGGFGVVIVHCVV